MRAAESSSSLFRAAAAGDEPSPHRPTNSNALLGWRESTAKNEGRASSSSLSNGHTRAAAVALPIVDLSYYQQYKRFGTQEYQVAFGITSLAEVILDRVLTEMPENPWTLMAAVCKEWNEKAFAEAEALYGEEAMMRSRSNSPAATNTTFASVLNNNNNNNSGGSFSSYLNQSDGMPFIHIVGGRPSQPRAPSVGSVGPSGASLICHPPVLSWQNSRPAIPPSNPSRHSQLKDKSYPHYWSPLAREEDEKQKMSLSAGGFSKPRNSDSSPSSGNGGSGGAALFTYACRDYVQRHRIACVIDEWFFAVTSQKPFSPALFSYNYFRQRARMRMAVRQEEELGIQLTDQERERARSIRSLSRASEQRQTEQSEFTIPEIPITAGASVNEKPPTKFMSRAPQSSRSGEIIALDHGTPADKSGGIAMAAVSSRFGLESASHQVAAALVKKNEESQKPAASVGSNDFQLKDEDAQSAAIETSKIPLSAYAATPPPPPTNSRPKKVVASDEGGKATRKQSKEQPDTYLPKNMASDQSASLLDQTEKNKTQITDAAVLPYSAGTAPLDSYSAFTAVAKNGSNTQDKGSDERSKVTNILEVPQAEKLLDSGQADMPRASADAGTNDKLKSYPSFDVGASISPRSPASALIPGLMENPSAVYGSFGDDIVSARSSPSAPLSGAQNAASDLVIIQK